MTEIVDELGIQIRPDILILQAPGLANNLQRPILLGILRTPGDNTRALDT